MPDARKVAVAMSGGVDSSVAAALLKGKGYQVIGVTMRTWRRGASSLIDRRPSCYGPGEDEMIAQAQRVAEILQIPHYTFDLSQEYETDVLDYFRREYLRGRTPNPCIRCNQRLKFKALMQKALSSGLQFDYFASGHYAQVEYEEKSGRYQLKKAKDEKKDQSYFLSSLSQHQLSRLLLPLGGHHKAEVREMARSFGLPTDAAESQNFSTGGYLWLFGELWPGPILDREGHVLGQHQGLPSYTIGQRRRLGIATGRPLYVIDIDPERNTLIVGSKEEIYSQELVASELNWIAVEKLEQPIRAKVKIRYKHEGAEAKLSPLDGGEVQVKFDEPQPAVTPGQAVVFYQGEVVLGGGIIEKANRSPED